MITIYAHTPKMASVNVVTIRVKKNRFLVRRERPLFHFAISWREQLRRSSLGGECVKVLPAVFFGSDDELIVGCPIEHAAARIIRHVRKRALRCSGAVPDFFRRSSEGFGHPDRPPINFVRPN